MEWINLDIFTSLFIVTSMTDALLFLFYQYKHNKDCSPLLAYKKKKNKPNPKSIKICTSMWPY